MVILINGSARVDGNTAKAITKLTPFKDYKLIQLCNLRIAQYAYDIDPNAVDDFATIVDGMISSTDIIFATPVYWYAMSGHMKVFFDRLTELITVQKDLGRKLKGKRCYLIACGTDEALPDGFEVPFKKTCDYFGMEFKGTFYQKMN